MCEANAYLVNGEEELLLMETVTVIRVKGGEVVLSDLFGGQKRIRGRLCEVNLTTNRVVIELKK
jgi:predicted RNA-binding protein